MTNFGRASKNGVGSRIDQLEQTRMTCSGSGKVGRRYSYTIPGLNLLGVEFNSSKLEEHVSLAKTEHE